MQSFFFLAGGLGVYKTPKMRTFDFECARTEDSKFEMEKFQMNIFFRMP